MVFQLREALNNYRSITIKLIEELEKDNYDALETLLSDRQMLIEQMNKINYSANEFKSICNELQILMLQEKLTKLMNIKRTYVKDKLDKFSARKTANRSYSKRFSVDALYFNKKI
ncbi:flagellar protein FliT [Clostridium sp. SYSU_GA19001]|uniref:flagellar protein FliT n=1 Tax=Clostridium caldaquaticum TaxID=2940653 RepID=UPI00207722C2|nr:flagellar protein FliT [Clostridium caldaquaticum]MCM8710962.1 flagellar protein FliT [Clostridium caldaquaticum]